MALIMISTILAAPAEIVDPRATTSERAHDSDSLHHPSASTYDFGSPADKLVEDMLSDEFWNLWHGTAQVNTEVYEKVFRPMWVQQSDAREAYVEDADGFDYPYSARRIISGIGRLTRRISLPRSGSSPAM